MSGTAKQPVNEKREYVRTAVALAAEYGLVSDATKSCGEIVNLGGGGVRLASAEDIPVGSIVELRFALQPNEPAMLARGKVVLSFFEGANSRFAHGIAFTQIAPDDQQKIIAFVAQQTAAA